MDLKSLNLTGTYDHVVFHPGNNQPIRGGADNKPWTIKLLGTYSKKYQDQIARAQDRRLAAKGKIRVTAAELDSEKTELVLACVTGWENAPKLDGKDLGPYSEDAARMLIDHPERKWLRDQLNDEIENEANFTSK